MPRQCLLDSYQITECPRCKRNISTVDPSGDLRVLCNLNNEGGLQEGLDIFQLLAEESYLKAYPEERKCRAYLEFCKEGDVDAIVDLLDDNEEEEAEMAGAALPSKEILRYQDAMGSMYTGLHVAVIHGQVDVVWLLLFLASDLHVEQFPAEVFRAAERLGVSRENQRGHADIRALKDASGKTAEQLAAGMGDLWQSWLESGRLLASEQC